MQAAPLCRRLVRVAVAVAVLGPLGLSADDAGQAPAAPTNLRLFRDSGGTTTPSSFVGTTFYVSPSGVDTNAGTPTSPVRTIQRGVTLANQANAAGQAARVLVAGGVYRESVNLGVQKTDKQFVLEGTGSNATILTGADDWTTGWTAQPDGSLVHSWPYKWGIKTVPSGWESYWNWDGNGYKRDILRRSETVYVNGAPLRGVLTANELSAGGTFYVDEGASRLSLRLPTGVTLAGSLIEVGIRQNVLTVDGPRNVVLRNFAVMRSRGAVQDTAVSVKNGQNVSAENLAVRWTAYAGFGTAYITGLQIRGSVFSDNGVTGLGGYRDKNVVLEDTEIARNNWRGWPAEHKGWDSVMKWLNYRDAIARRVRVVDNSGNGFWLDSDNQRVTLENSLISGNQLLGVNLEMNQGPVIIAGNRICNNMTTGVGDAQSTNVTLRNNQIFNNTQYNILFTGTYAGRSVTDYLTGATTLLRSEHWTVTGNTIAGSGSQGWLWTHTDYLTPGAWSIVRNSLVAFNSNAWYHSARANAFWLPQGTIAYTAFKGDIQLANASFETQSNFTQSAPTLSCTMP